jgi:hypothetical protein
MLRALGDVLQLPRDYLIYVGQGNLAELKRSGAEPDLLRWTLALFPGEEGVE